MEAKPRPHCGFCTKPYGWKAPVNIFVTFKAGEPPPPPSVDYIEVMDVDEWPYDHGWRKRRYAIWVGDWEAVYTPFCSMNCALRYGRRAFSKDEAIRIEQSHQPRDRGATTSDGGGVRAQDNQHHRASRPVPRVYREDEDDPPAS